MGEDEALRRLGSIMTRGLFMRARLPARARAYHTPKQAAARRCLFPVQERCTLLVVSHDLAELAPLVDCAWRMKTGGTCEGVSWPPADLAVLEQ